MEEEMDERTERISLRAYEIWERLGRPEGGHMEHWLEAEREIDAAMTDAAHPAPMPARPKTRGLRGLRSLSVSLGKIGSGPGDSRPTAAPDITPA
jgi:hypothetical protein